MAKPADYSNKLVEASNLQEQLEKACQTLQDAHAYEAALQAADLYGRVAPPGKGALRAGKIAETWARELRDQGAQASDPQARAKGDKARELYLQAGRAFQLAAEVLEGDDRAAQMWHAVDCFLQGQEHQQAVTSLKTYVQLPLPVERLGEAWYRMAESLSTLKLQSAEEQAYLECLKYPSPYAYQARLQLAYHDMFVRQYPDQGQREKALDNVEAMLKQNVTLNGPNANREAQEKSLYLWADPVFRRGKFPEALFRLEEGLTLYPQNVEAGFYRAMLADCCRKLAERDSLRLRESLAGGNVKPEERDRRQRAIREFLDKAAENYFKILEALDQCRQSRAPTKEEDALAARARLGLAHSRLEAYGKDDIADALPLYQILAKDFATRIEGLIAYRNIIYCSNILGRSDLAKSAIASALALCETLPDNVFPACSYLDTGRGTALTTKAAWKDWLKAQP